ncbi:MAG: hypothetical protein KGM24_00165, partial [Elusimicrobia bacterium]|nr:hypothetical protein [Elusimicrobiota bacterium]
MNTIGSSAAAAAGAAAGCFAAPLRTYSATPSGTLPPITQQFVTEATTASATIAQEAKTLYNKAAQTPVLVLDIQTLLDQRGINVDIRDKFGEFLQQLS